MPLLALTAAGLTLGLEQLVGWEYGPVGVLAFLALSVGLKARNTLLGSVGAVVLVLLVTRTA